MSKDIFGHLGRYYTRVKARDVNDVLTSRTDDEEDVNYDQSLGALSPLNHPLNTIFEGYEEYFDHEPNNFLAQSFY